LVSRWRSQRPPWLPTEVIVLLVLWHAFGVEVVFLAVSFDCSLPSPESAEAGDQLLTIVCAVTVYQGLIPWAWIEASTKGAVLLFVASEGEYYARTFGAGDFAAGITGGVLGGVAQAYATMGFCTCMKTVEITKSKLAAQGVKPPGTFATFMDIYRKEGIKGINKGVNAVAIRQMTNWGSRFGLSRLAEQGIRKVSGKEEGSKLNAWEKILASGLGGGLSAWNQPIEVIRVEMQSKTVDPNRPAKMTVGNTAKYIYSTNGIQGLYRGVVPRIGLGVWQTICMVAMGDM